jgi:hypothetical protein
MGDAKRRGTLAQRIQQSHARNERKITEARARHAAAQAAKQPKRVELVEPLIKLT